MKYLHVMHNSIISTSYIKFITTNFNNKEHKFIIKKDNRTLFLILKDLRKYYTEIKKAEKVYFHGLFDPSIILFLFIFRSFLKKSNWIIWGGDLYCYEKRRNKLIYKLWYKIEDYVKKNIAYVNTLVPQDYDIAKEYYKIKGKYKKAIYAGKKDYDFLDNLIIKKKDEIYIQVGNSADPSNNHFEILDMLKKFKNEKIKIFCILSYGNKSYGLKVNEYGVKHFGNKFIGIFDFMPANEYWAYLKNIDILVFNQKRQQGLGNIFMLSYFEKKIYLRNNISSWSYLTDDLKLKINSYEDIKNETFEDFIRNDSVGNRNKIVSTVFSNEYVKRIWEDNFNN